MATALFAMLALLAGCGSDPDPVITDQPADFLDDLPLASVEDLDPDPHVLEVELTAQLAEIEIEPGVKSTVWTYNGSLPGPLLRLTAGDLLRVHFKNELPEATTIHWHGLRIPNDMDGMPGHTQASVEPGETFEYEFVVPDAGTFWYHPHENDAAQLGFGMYGAIVVDPVEPEPADLGDEVVLVLSDISLDESGALAPADQGGDLATVFGREGALVLANGKVAPTIHARNGKRQRWRVVNAARSRYFQLELAGHTFERVGGQAGLLSQSEELEHLVLMPGERAEVLVTPTGQADAQLAVNWIPFDRGYGSTEYRDPIKVLALDLEGAPIPREADVATLGAPIDPIEVEHATHVDIHLTLGEGPDGRPEMGINGAPFGESPPVPAAVGETQVWTITNDMDWDHPFHLHGFFFQAVDREGKVVEPVEWRDTLNVVRKGESSRFVVRYDNRPGSWMFHCHILDHADAGMMGMVELE
ncbi:MAG: multicopper oxidase family protein [Polyangiaceae bacterium]